jgi:signal transduction histidine kinase
MPVSARSLIERGERLLIADPSPRTRFLVIAASAVTAVVVSVLDYVTGPGRSLAAFYVLVVVVIALVGGARAGLVGAALTAAVWTIADAFIRELKLSIWDDLWNVAVEFVALAVVALLVRALRDSVAESRRAAETSREFLAMAAHQLRTPVAAVRTSVDALIQSQDQGDRDRLLANVAGESARLGRLINALLRAARLDQGEVFTIRRVDLAAVVAGEVERMRELSSLQFDIATADGALPAVAADPTALAEALANVFDNARRHAVAKVVVRIAGPRHGMVSVDITDDGPGLPAGREASAFDRFVAFDGRGGAGLGLSIARDLLRRQGGDLVYTDRTFSLLVPLDGGPSA